MPECVGDVEDVEDVGDVGDEAMDELLRGARKDESI